ncbi:MAG: hypothetical protein OXG65_09945 [Chloroflexi bacterium]|nr:hypothetical protein [Chloroflexota bacterium]
MKATHVFQLRLILLSLIAALLAVPAPALADDPPPTSQFAATVLRNSFTKPDDRLTHNVPDLQLTIGDDVVSCGFLTHYESTGALIRWGFPTSEVLEERPGALTQYYQRGVVDCHQRNGVWLLERRLAWDYLGGGIAGSVDLGVEPHLLSQQPGLELGPWGHRVSNFAFDGTPIGFLDFFNALGSVTAFGFPKTDARPDDDSRAVLRIPGATPGFIRQYFQAAVLEYHPGTTQPVKLRLLGDDVRNIVYPANSHQAFPSFGPAGPLTPGQIFRPGGTSERAALTALFHATDGPNWTNNSNWLTDAPLGHWHGVTSAADGRVVEIDLADNRLRGELPTQLGGLSRLVHLFLLGNGLRGHIPDEFSLLRSLQSLYIGGNQLSGQIPSRLGDLAALMWLDLSANLLYGSIPGDLGRLSNLRVLNLGSNRLTDPIPTELSRLSHLTVLNLGSNHLTGRIPADLGRLSRLNTLHLSGNRLHGSIPATLGDLAALTWLDLGANQLSGAIPGELRRLSNLTVLNLSANLLQGTVPTGLGDLVNLQVLRLANNQLVGCIPEWLRNVGQNDALELGLSFCDAARTPASDREALEILYNATGGPSWRNNANWLSDRPLSEWHGVTANRNDRVIVLSLTANNLRGILPPAIGHLASLQYLHMNQNQLQGELPQSLGSLEWLTIMEFYNNKLHGKIPAWIGEMRRLRILDLGVNQFGGSIPAELGRLSNLTYLDLTSNQLTGTIPAALGDLTRLKQLNARGNQVRGPIPPELGRMSSLEAISLADNNLQGAIPPELANLANLRDLGLARNRLEGEIPSFLGRLTNLNRISLRLNRLRGDIPPELGQLPNLLRLEIAGNALTGCYPANFRNLVHHDLAELGLPFCQ